MQTNKTTTALHDIVTPLLRWYHSHARILPWRENPEPYFIWVSEIMLQQTRVEAVKPYFDRFISALPTIESLAKVPESELLKLWEGLGYYNRARNLQKAAQEIVINYDGKLPANYNELLSLPGIGPYTAGAIASIAYQIPVPAVDGNVLRVITRLLASRDDIMKEKTRKKIEAYLKQVIPLNEAGNFNQALMELGAMVCLPKGAAKCYSCPLKRLCLSFSENCINEIPVKTPKKARRIENYTMLHLQYQNKIALQKRPSTGLLANLWELPHLDTHMTKAEIITYFQQKKYKIKEITLLPSAKHIFTHLEWHMIGYYIDLEEIPIENTYHWISPQKLINEYAVPTAFKVYL